jgi:hypothetical protein
MRKADELMYVSDRYADKSSAAYVQAAKFEKKSKAEVMHSHFLCACLAVCFHQCVHAF